MKTCRNLLSVVLPLFISASAASAQTLAQWTFDINTPADLVNSTTIAGLPADVGTGTASGTHASAATDWTTPAGNGSDNSLSANTWAVGDYYQFSLSTAGYSGLGVSFDATGSGTGPRDFSFAYSTDGLVFTDFANYTVLLNGAPNLSWSTANGNQSAYTTTFDLSSITALDNAASVYFRLVNTSTVSINEAVVGTGGTSRVDNFAVYVVPEPASAALIGLGLLALISARRRN